MFALGAGGGGGVQFTTLFDSGQANGLGLGAGSGNKAALQYSYYKNLAQVCHYYDPTDGHANDCLPVQAQYSMQLNKLKAQLQNADEVIVSGGGGLGNGMEFLKQPTSERERLARD